MEKSYKTQKLIEPNDIDASPLTKKQGCMFILLQKEDYYKRYNHKTKIVIMLTSKIIIIDFLRITLCVAECNSGIQKIIRKLI